MAIPKTVKQLDWIIQEKDEATHRLKIKTRGGFISYPSTLKVELSTIDEKKTRMNLVAETPVTTITSIADYGRTRNRISQFVVALGKLLSGQK